MLVISAGMPKSGSGYIYNLINDLLVCAGHKNARDIKEKYALSDVMQYYNNNVGSLNRKKLLYMVFLSIKEGSFAVKTHDKPSSTHNFFLKLRLIKTIYIYRDPRDVLLSAQDHGRKIVAEGKSHTFANLLEFEAALKAVKAWVKVFEAYSSLGNNVLCLSYEELIESPQKVLFRVCQYLKIEVSAQDVNSVLKNYEEKSLNDMMKSALHFNKGKTCRYITELNETEKQRFQAELGTTIKKMGYSI